MHARERAIAAGIWDILPDDEAVHVTVPGRNAGPRQGVCVHRTAVPHHEDTAIRDRLRLTSPARTICDQSSHRGAHPPADGRPVAVDG